MARKSKSRVGRYNITMPADLWQELKDYTERQNDPDATVSGIIRRLVRAFLASKAKGGERK